MPIPGQAPRLCYLTGTISWSDSTPFDGYLLAGLAYPTYGSNTPYPKLVKGQGSAPFQTLPQWAKIQILNGQFDQNSGLFWNTDIDPPNSKYVFYYYTNNDVQVAGPSALVTLAAASFFMTNPSPTAPSAPVVGPSPQS